MLRPALPRSPSGMLFALASGLLAANFVGNLLLQPLDPDPEKAQTRYILQVFFNAGLSLLVPLALLRARRMQGRVRLGVAGLALGLAAWTVGNWTWSYYNFTGVDVAYPSFADAGYLAFDALATAGLAVLFSQARRRLEGIDIALAVAFPLTIAVLFYTFLIAGRVHSEDSVAAQVLNVVYPSVDMVYVALAGLVLYFTRRSAVTASLRRFAGALLLLALTDIVFIVGVDQGFYFTGSWVDDLYIVAFGVYTWGLLRFDVSGPEEPARAAPWSPSAAK
jgi:hypothetical protein